MNSFKPEYNHSMIRISSIGVSIAASLNRAVLLIRSFSGLFNAYKNATTDRIRESGLSNANEYLTLASIRHTPKRDPANAGSFWVFRLVKSLASIANDF